jgi:hypothetical protein
MNQPIHSNWHILFLKHMVLWHPSLHQPSGSWAVFQCSGLTSLLIFIIFGDGWGWHPGPRPRRGRVGGVHWYWRTGRWAYSQALLTVLYIEAEETNHGQGLLSASSHMIYCMEMDITAYAEPQMESTGAGRCCTACTHPFSGGEDHHQRS